MGRAIGVIGTTGCIESRADKLAQTRRKNNHGARCSERHAV
jgi:hypothetical protein